MPQARIAEQLRVSRATVSTWSARFRAEGWAGLEDRSSRPHTIANRTNPYDGLHVAVDEHSGVAYIEVLPGKPNATCAWFLHRAVGWSRERGVRVLLLNRTLPTPRSAAVPRITRLAAVSKIDSLVCRGGQPAVPGRRGEPDGEPVEPVGRGTLPYSGRLVPQAGP